MNEIQTEIDLRLLLNRTALRLSAGPSSDCLINWLPLLNRTRELRLVLVVLYIGVTVDSRRVVLEKTRNLGRTAQTNALIGGDKGDWWYKVT